MGPRMNAEGGSREAAKPRRGEAVKGACGDGPRMCTDERRGGELRRSREVGHAVWRCVAIFRVPCPLTPDPSPQMGARGESVVSCQIGDCCVRSGRALWHSESRLVWWFGGRVDA